MVTLFRFLGASGLRPFTAVSLQANICANTAKRKGETQSQPSFGTRKENGRPATISSLSETRMTSAPMSSSFASISLQFSNTGPSGA